MTRSYRPTSVPAPARPHPHPYHHPHQHPMTTTANSQMAQQSTAGEEANFTLDDRYSNLPSQGPETTQKTEGRRTASAHRTTPHPHHTTPAHATSTHPPHSTGRSCWIRVEGEDDAACATTEGDWTGGAARARHLGGRRGQSGSEIKIKLTFQSNRTSNLTCEKKIMAQLFIAHRSRSGHLCFQSTCTCVKAAPSFSSSAKQACHILHFT